MQLLEARFDIDLVFLWISKFLLEKKENMRDTSSTDVPPTLSNRSTFCLFPDNIFSLPDNMSTSPTWVDDHWWDQSSGNLDKKPLSYYNWTNMKRGNVIVIGQFKHKEYVAWWRSSGSPLSIAGIGKSGQIVRGDIWTRKSIPQPADPTTTQTLNI